ncbi:MAG: hypothetical protein U0838_13430 [Chloroflexota bacterium]
MPRDASLDPTRPSRAYVAFGEPLPPGYVTLADAATPSGFAHLEATLRPLTETDRKAALTVVHYAVAAVAETVLVWLLEDGILLDLEPSDLGLCLDETGASTAWLRSAPEARQQDPTSAGEIGWRLIGPVVEAAIGLGGTPRRGTTTIAADALVAAARRTGRQLGREPDDAWLQSFATGLGRPDHPLGRPLQIWPDPGPPVTYHVPRVCCVLATDPSDHACPTCPQLPSDAARAASLLALLNDLSDEDFAAETGRARVLGGQMPDVRAEG